jgi:hypothetical protein
MTTTTKRKPMRRHPRARQATSKIAEAQPQLGGDLFKHPDATISGKVHRGVNKRISKLPFVRDRKRGEKGARCFWQATATGKYMVDYQRGRDWAQLTLPFLRYNTGPLLISWIVHDMVRAKDTSGLVLGFIRGLADHLQNTRQLLVFAVALGNPTRLSAATRDLKAPPEQKKRLKKAFEKIRPKLREIVSEHYADAL